MALPLGFQRGDIDDDAAARIGGLSQTNSQDIARNTEILNGAGQRKGVRWNHADVALNMHKTVLVEAFGVHGRRVDVGEDFEFPRTPDVVTITRGAIGD